MTYQELYQEIITPGKTKVSFPYSYEDGEDLIDCYERLFHQYIDLLSQVDKENTNSLNRDTCIFLQAYNALPERELDVIRDAKELSEATLKCVCTHLAGYPSEAYNEYKDFFSRFSFYHFNSLPRLILHPGKSFYRVRNKEGLAGKYGELFHIPFEMRSKVSAERFSIPGLPALYLSGSLITACMETGVKKEDTFAYSRFENVSDLEFIDLSIFNKPIEKDVWEYFSFLVNYPLIMACHIPVKCPSDPFNPHCS